MTATEVRLDGEIGAFIFWIDQKTRLLRRIEYPVGNDPMQGSLVADYQNLTTDPQVKAEQFSLTPPSNKRLVRNFVLPPMDSPPQILNQTVRELDFQDPNFGKSKLSWKNHATLLCWFDRHPGSRAAMEELKSVYEKWPKDKPVSFVAVFSESTTAVSNADIRQIAADWAIPFPVVRDIQAHGRDVFEIAVSPSLVAIDAQGVVQLVEQGVDPQLREQLPIVLERLIAGDALAEHYLELVKRKRKAYEEALLQASADAPQAKQPFAVELKPVTPPQHLQLKRVWEIPNSPNPECPGPRSPDDSVRLHVIADGRVLELDASGEFVKERSRAGEIHQLVAFPDRTGTTFAGWSNLGRRVTVWNNKWQTQFQYPPQDTLPGIQAAHLTDVDQDGASELYVAFADGEGGGVHRVNTTGSQAGKNGLGK